MTNVHTEDTTATDNNETTTVSLRGKTGWKTLGNAFKATIGIASTTVQTAGHGYTKALEMGLDMVPGDTGKVIAKTALRKGLGGYTGSIKSNEATEAAIDSIYYAKESLFGHTKEYATWFKSLTADQKEDLKDALEDDKITIDQIEKALLTSQEAATELVGQA